MSALAIVETNIESISRPDLVAKFRAWLNVRNLSETTKDVYAFRLGKFLDWLNGRSWLQVDQLIAVDYRDHLALCFSPATVSLHLVAARRFYGFLLEAGVFRINPFVGVSGPRRSGKSRRETISPDEWRDLLATCDGSPSGLRSAAIFWLAYGLGLRQIEIHRADLADLTYHQSRPILWVQSKGAPVKSDWLVIPPEVGAALRGWMGPRGDAPGALFPHLSGSGRLSLSAIRQIWNDHKRQAGIVGDAKTFHSLRHAAIDGRARYAVRHGRSPLLVQAFARHRSMDTTMIYIHGVERWDDPPELWLSPGVSV